MKTPLIPIDIISIYKNSSGYLQPLPSRMAKCTPDTYSAIFKIASDLSKKGGKLILSDLFRSYDMQAQSHYDYISGKKKAYSPAPGGSFHEAGRAFDLDLNAIKISLADFWNIAKKYGVYPIIDEPDTSKSEAWHFDCRGSHQIVFQYYDEGKGTNFKPYKAAAASAILSIGEKVDAFGGNQIQANIQSCIIRLGKEIGNIDGHIGYRTQNALEDLGVSFEINNLGKMLNQVENLVQQKFSSEFIMPSVS
ncbi:D-alanyl-D-alanine carboxypeptidase family protein [Flectobacillus longus]|uniref:D-alanyl-D-alanine carboxypeptidase family protein n=1 Tax=Flectobacillus longus TaxID=2984207 RepID=UPI0024B6953A|nr:D-alanyl-D-alanine carboxypeptidase family protein [Flectobacillus longus]MDI9882752.1 D-alanyl-D-alanine carboxypeptidase family protein [Flectobacillus longus]